MDSIETQRYELAAEITTFSPGVPFEWRFEVRGPAGRPRAYRVQHERELHLIVVRDDLTTFSHVHPTRQDDGTWLIDLELPFPGNYTAFVDVAPEDAPSMTLRLPLRAEGEWESGPVPTTSMTASVDGYLVEVSGDVVAASGSDIAFHISRDGRPVTTDLYLGAAGHLVAIKSGDLDYLHVHPMEGDEPGVIPFMMHAPSPGIYRLFLQFLHAGAVRTVDFTVEASAGQSHRGPHQG